MADIRKFKPEIVVEVDRLLSHHRDQEIADILNSRGLKTGEGKCFQRTTISSLRESYNLPSHHERLRMRGKLTTRELANHFQVTDSTIHYWGRQGLIKNCYPDSRISALWELPAGYTIAQGKPGPGNPARLIPVIINQPNEV